MEEVTIVPFSEYKSFYRALKSLPKKSGKTVMQKNKKSIGISFLYTNNQLCRNQNLNFFTKDTKT